MVISKPKHAILFGGAGFIGSQLVVTLSRAGWHITVVTRRPHRHRNLLVIPSLKLVHAGDLSSAFIAKLISEADVVVNLIGILNQTRTKTFNDLHIHLPERIAEVCLQNRANRLINLSALGAAIDAPSQYLKSRAYGEQALRMAMEKGLNCTIIRPSIVFGPRDSFSRMFFQLLSMSPVFFPLIMPNAIIQPVYVRDVVHCLFHAIQVQIPENDSFDVAGPERFTLREFIQLIDRLGGMHHRIIGLSPALSKLLASVTQFVPGKPLTPDNVLSLQAPHAVRPATPLPYGVQSTTFESVAGTWLSRQINQLDQYRAQAGR